MSSRVPGELEGGGVRYIFELKPKVTLNPNDGYGSKPGKIVILARYVKEEGYVRTVLVEFPARFPILLARFAESLGGLIKEIGMPSAGTLRVPVVSCELPDSSAASRHMLLALVAAVVKDPKCARKYTSVVDLLDVYEANLYARLAIERYQDGLKAGDKRGVYESVLRVGRFLARLYDRCGGGE